jgi:hypothetical protein
MINVTNKLAKAWYQLLDGNLSVPVYRVDAPASETGNYVLIRVESDSDTPNNHVFYSNPVVITEVVTKFDAMIDADLAGDSDSEISELLYPTTPGKHALPAQDDIQIVSVQRRDATYLPEFDGTYRYHRLITRNVHRIGQFVNQS